MLSSKPINIKIGTRSSKLALAQVAEVHLLLSELPYKLNIDIIPIKTSGDINNVGSLAEIGGKGLFVKELELALLNKTIDIAVHSSKDMPPVLACGTDIVATTQRLNPFDCLISRYPNLSSLSDLPQASKIGTCSPRRTAFLQMIRPDLQIICMRGNIDTRLNKLKNKEVDALILAYAGLERIECQHLAQFIFTVEQMLPAGGQGCLSLQTRNDDQLINSIAKLINHQDSHLCLTAERQFLLQMQADCTTPIGCYATVNDSSLTLHTATFDNGQCFKKQFTSTDLSEQAIKNMI